VTTYLCDKDDCVGGEVDMWDDGIVPKCWGFAGDDPHPMTRASTPTAEGPAQTRDVSVRIRGGARETEGNW
jgi:hypothetical protein